MTFGRAVKLPKGNRSHGLPSLDFRLRASSAAGESYTHPWQLRVLIQTIEELGLEEVLKPHVVATMLPSLLGLCRMRLVPALLLTMGHDHG